MANASRSSSRARVKKRRLIPGKLRKQLEGEIATLVEQHLPASTRRAIALDYGASAENDRPRHFVERSGANGDPRYYWQPSHRLSKLGWSCTRLPKDFDRARQMAEQLNAAVDRWRLDGSRPLNVRECDLPKDHDYTEDRPSHGSVNHLISLYRASGGYMNVQSATRQSYDNYINQISKDFGRRQAVSISVAELQEKYDLIRADHPTKAYKYFEVIRLIYNYAMRLEHISSNPASSVKMVSPEPRRTIWTDDEVDLFVRTAERLGAPAIGTAVMLGVFLGQRLADLLSLTWSDYKDGRFLIRQAKTDSLVAVRPVAELAQRLAAMRRHSEHILIDDETGRPFSYDRFNHHFRRIRDKAAVQHPEVARLWFIDLRRTCVVRMGEADCTEAQIAAVSGHSIDTSRKILEVYLPRTQPMADMAIAKVEARRGKRTTPANEALGRFFTTTASLAPAANQS